MELNKSLVVNGKKNKMAEFTLIFPALKKKVKRIDIVEGYSEEAALQPTNGAPWGWQGIRVADYGKKRRGDYLLIV